jgi:hypothetical protein
MYTFQLSAISSQLRITPATSMTTVELPCPPYSLFVVAARPVTVMPTSSVRTLSLSLLREAPHRLSDRELTFWFISNEFDS